MNTESTGEAKTSAWRAASSYSTLISLVVFGVPTYLYLSESSRMGQLFLYLWLDFVDYFAGSINKLGAPDILSYGIPNLIQTALLVFLGVFIGAWYINRYYRIADKKKIIILSTILFFIIGIVYYIYNFIAEGVLQYPDDFDTVDFSIVFFQLILGTVLFYFLSNKYIRETVSADAIQPSLGIQRQAFFIHAFILAIPTYIGFILLITGLNYFRFGSGEISFQVHYNVPDVQETILSGLTWYLFDLFPQSLGYVWFWITHSFPQILIDLLLIVGIFSLLKKWQLVLKIIPWIILLSGIGLYGVAEIHYSKVAEEDKSNREEYKEQYIVEQNASIISKEIFLWIEQTDQYNSRAGRKLVISDISGNNRRVLRDLQSGEQTIPFISPGGSFYLKKFFKVNTPVQQIYDWNGKVLYELSEEPWEWSWSPNERFLVSQPRRGYGRFAEPAKVFLHDIVNKKTILLTSIPNIYEFGGLANFSNTPISFAWSDDSERIFFPTKEGIVEIDGVSAINSSTNMEIKLLPDLIPCSPIVYYDEKLYCSVTGKEIGISSPTTRNEYTANKIFYIIEQSLGQKDQKSFRVVNKDTPTNYLRAISAIDNNYLLVDIPGENIDLFGIRSILDLQTGKFINIKRYKSPLIFKSSWAQRYFENK